MKISITNLLLIFLILVVPGMTGCSTSNPTPSPSPAPISPVNLTLIQGGATVATGAILNFAVTQPTSRARLANEIYASGNAIYSLTGGTLPNVQQFSSALVAWGVAGDAQYAGYTTALTAIYQTYYQKYVGGSITASNLAAVLNALAAGAEAGAQAYTTLPIQTITPST